MTDKDLAQHYKGRITKPELKYLNYKNFHIYHAIVGNITKPLLIFIHGSPGAWYSYLRLMDDSLLQQNFRMISVDRVGFGKSNYGLSVPSIDEHVRYLEKIVNESNVSGQKIYLVGSSYGAPIAASFVTQNPDLVQELYLISPVIDPSTEKLFWFSYAAKIGPVSWWLPQNLNVTNDEKFAHRRELRRLKPFLKDITCKTYVIMGTKDWIADKSNFTYTQKMLVNAKDPE
ncbi:MAG: alpha/beta hydrolase, partial [Bacteroidota bacterium]|nr:alpha/beta hydrolase [Bacteroidota bacterium]